MMARGRQRYGIRPRGSKHWMARLSEADVRFIRSQRGLVKQGLLAEQFGMSQTQISDIQLRKSWKHID